MAVLSDRSEVASAFDSISVEYDALWTETPVGILQRYAVWGDFERFFHAGDLILEIGCGTGADAVHLARRGIRVHATDVSANMLLAAQDRIRNEDLSDRITLESGTIEGLSMTLGASTFDGAFSNFGAFNCIQDLRCASSCLAKLVRPGGKLGICIMGRLCLWEMAWFLLHGRPKDAFRRFRGTEGGTTVSLGGVSFQIYYPTAARMIAAFRPDFSLVSSSGIGILVPPTCMEAWARKKRKTLEFLDVLDRHIRHFPIMRAVGDHRLYWFEKSRRQWSADEE